MSQSCLCVCVGTAFGSRVKALSRASPWTWAFWRYFVSSASNSCCRNANSCEYHWSSQSCYSFIHHYVITVCCLQVGVSAACGCWCCEKYVCKDVWTIFDLRLARDSSCTNFSYNTQKETQTHTESVHTHNIISVLLLSSYCYLC